MNRHFSFFISIFVLQPHRSSTISTLPLSQGECPLGEGVCVYSIHIIQYIYLFYLSLPIYFYILPPLHSPSLHTPSEPLALVPLTQGDIAVTLVRWVFAGF